MKQLKIPPLAEGEIYIGCVGGDLPNRIEQAMLWANHRDQFQQEWYWSNEPHQSESGWAWGQCFGYGTQRLDGRGNEFRARAVRRLPI